MFCAFKTLDLFYLVINMWSMSLSSGPDHDGPVLESQWNTFLTSNWNPLHNSKYTMFLIKKEIIWNVLCF